MFFYNEAIIQFGFIILFSPAFSLAPLFSVVTNALEIKIKLNSMSYYSRRMTAEGANGIGAWLPIMEFVAMVSIPVNVALIYWTGNIETGMSSLVEVLSLRDSERWTPFNIFLLCVALEHVLIFLK